MRLSTPFQRRILEPAIARARPGCFCAFVAGSFVCGKRDTYGIVNQMRALGDAVSYCLVFSDFQLPGNKESISVIFIEGRRESTSVR